MSYQQKLIQLEDRRFVVATYSLSKEPSRRWVVFLPESGSDFRPGHRRELASLVGTEMGQHFNFLVVNKSGLAAQREDKKVFEESFRRERRIDDALTVCRNLIPKGDSIHLVGYSEGAYLAPQLALLDRRVRSVTMIGGGTRGWLKEELANVVPKEKRKLEKVIKEIYKNPNADRKWGGFSYATWYSYRGDQTLKALRELKVPALAILGARDRMIDFKSTIVDLMSVSQRKPLQVHVFGNCGHYFTRHWSTVNRLLARFLSEQL